MHWTYAEKDSSNLRQGDILDRTSELLAVIEKYHKYYYQHPQNKYFIILTQCCDLYQRSDEPISTRYISIGMVRPLSYVIGNVISFHKDAALSDEVPICTEKTRSRIRDFFERLYNNNEKDFFYLRRDPELDFPEDCCAFLRLSIPIKSEHYKTCLDARKFGLSDEFRPKLGWLVGQIYSRVGTKEWTEKEDILKEINDTILPRAIWIDNRRLKMCRDEISKWKEKNPGKTPSRDDISAFASKFKTKKEETIERIGEIIMNSPKLSAIIKKHDLQNDFVDVLIRNLISDSALTQLLK